MEMKRTRYIYMTMLYISIIILSSLQLHQTYAKEQQQQQHALYQLPSSQITNSLIEHVKNMDDEKTPPSEKATILANLLATSFLEYGAYNGQINVGFDPEEGLPEPTPQCKRIMNHWTKKCLVGGKKHFSSPGIYPDLDSGASNPHDGGGGGGNGGGGAPGDENEKPKGGGGGGCGGGLIGAIICLVKKVVKHVAKAAQGIGKALFGFKQINGTQVLIRYANNDTNNISNMWVFGPPNIYSSNNNNNINNNNKLNDKKRDMIVSNSNAVSSSMINNKDDKTKDDKTIDDDQLIQAAMKMQSGQQQT